MLSFTNRLNKLSSADNIGGLNDPLDKQFLCFHRQFQEFTATFSNCGSFFRQQHLAMKCGPGKAVKGLKGLVKEQKKRYSAAVKSSKNNDLLEESKRGLEDQIRKVMANENEIKLSLAKSLRLCEKALKEGLVSLDEESSEERLLEKDFHEEASMKNDRLDRSFNSKNSLLERSLSRCRRLSESSNVSLKSFSNNKELKKVSRRLSFKNKAEKKELTKLNPEKEVMTNIRSAKYNQVKFRLSGYN